MADNFVSLIGLSQRRCECPLWAHCAGRGKKSNDSSRLHTRRSPRRARVRNESMKALFRQQAKAIPRRSSYFDASSSS